MQCDTQHTHASTHTQTREHASLTPGIVVIVCGSRGVGAILSRARRVLVLDLEDDEEAEEEEGDEGEDEDEEMSTV